MHVFRKSQAPALPLPADLVARSLPSPPARNGARAGRAACARTQPEESLPPARLRLKQADRQSIGYNSRNREAVTVDPPNWKPVFPKTRPSARTTPRRSAAYRKRAGLRYAARSWPMQPRPPYPLRQWSLRAVVQSENESLIRSAPEPGTTGNWRLAAAR